MIQVFSKSTASKRVFTNNTRVSDLFQITSTRSLFTSTIIVHDPSTSSGSSLDSYSLCPSPLLARRQPGVTSYTKPKIQNSTRVHYTTLNKSPRQFTTSCFTQLSLQSSLSSFNNSPNRRFLSTVNTNNTTNNNDSNTISTNETLATSASSPESEMAKFEQLANQSTETITSSSNTLWEPIWWYPQDHFVNLINFFHETSGLNYTFTIAAITIILRTAMLPVFISAQQNAARMAHLSPELRILQEKQKRVDPSDTQAQMQMAKQFQALFKKYNVNPLKTLAGALLQFPAFMGMFLALRKMPEIFPEQLRDGGILWFQDLTIADPTLILPISSSISFLLMIEAGKQQMMSTNPQQGQIMLNVMRGLAVVMIPATMNFPTAVFCYWTTNNTFSLLQSLAFQNATVRKALDIWDLPKPVPGALPPKGVMESFNEMMDKRKKDQEERSMKEKIQLHNAAIDAKTKAELTKNDSDDAKNGFDVNAAERRKRRRGRK